MILFVCLFFIIVLLLNYIWNWKQVQWSLPPGPSPSLLLGNLNQLDKNDPRKTLYKWHKKYGPIYTVWIGMEPQICITGFDLMKEVFTKSGDSFADRSREYAFELETKGNYGIAVANGERWREQRRFTMHTLRNFGVGRPIMENRIKFELEKLMESLTRYSENPENKFNIADGIELCIGNVMFSLVFGRLDPPGKDSFMYRIKKKLDDSHHQIGTVQMKLLNSFPILRFVPLFDHFGVDVITNTMDDLFEMVKEEINLHKQKFDIDDESTDFTASYLKEMDRRNKMGEKNYFDEWQLSCVIKDLIAAGMDTTVKTLLWGILLMMRYPEIQEKVQKDIDEHIPRSRLPNVSDKNHLPYVNAVLNEVQRYGNILACNFTRNVKEPTTIDGYKIPKDIAIVPQISVVHMDETIFEKPEDFLPERFLESHNENAKKALDALIPFSIGKRMCMGESLARMEIYLIFTALLQKFIFSSPKEQPMLDLSPQIGFTVGPQPYLCSIKIRH